MSVHEKRSRRKQQKNALSYYFHKCKNEHKHTAQQHRTDPPNDIICAYASFSMFSSFFFFCCNSSLSFSSVLRSMQNESLSQILFLMCGGEIKYMLHMCCLSYTIWDAGILVRFALDLAVFIGIVQLTAPPIESSLFILSALPLSRFVVVVFFCLFFFLGSECVFSTACTTYHFVEKMRLNFLD